jgi:hypothetical protein
MKILEFQPYTECVRDVWKWWSGATVANGRPPRRLEIDPSAFVSALSKVWLVEWVAEIDGFRYRLAGEDIHRAHGMSLKGKTIEEILPAASRDRVDAAWREVLGAPAVAHQLGNIYEDAQTIRQGERLTLPILGEEGLDARYVFGVTAHLRETESEELGEAELLPNYNHVFFTVKELLAKKA